MKKSSLSLKVLGLLFLILAINTFLKAQPAKVVEKISDYYNKGKFEKAAEVCEKQDEEIKKACYYKLGAMYYKSDKYDEAAKYYLLSNNADAGIGLIAETLLKQKKIDEAAPFVAKLKNNDSYYQKLGYYSFQKGNYDDCKKYYNKSSKPHMGYKLVGDAYFVKQDYTNALANYEQSPTPNYGYFKMIKHYLIAKDTAKAIEFVHKLDTLDKGYIFIGNECIEKYIWNKDVKNYKKAYDFYSKAKNNQEVIKDKANLLFKKKKYEAAAFYFDKIKVSEKEAFSIADSFFKVRQDSIASSFYQKILGPEKGLLKTAEKATSLMKFSLAMDYYIKLYKNDPEKLTEKTELVIKAASANKYTSTATKIKVYEQAIEANPKIDKSIIEKTAIYYNEQGDYYKAIKYYESINDMEKIKANYLLLAEDCIKKRDYLSAFVAYKELNDTKKANSTLNTFFRNCIFDIVENKYKLLKTFESSLLGIAKKYGDQTVKSCLLQISTELSNEAVTVRKTLKPGASAYAVKVTEDISKAKKQGAALAKKIYVNYQKFKVGKDLKAIIK